LCDNFFWRFLIVIFFFWARSKCLDVFDKETYTYPIWLCPFKISSNAVQGKGRDARGHVGFIKPLDGESETMFVDIGGAQFTCFTGTRVRILTS
jgi:hypothetical protein